MESEGILIEILSRLTVKVLCRFKSVSKEWYKLISDPMFTSINRERTKGKPHMLFCRQFRRPRDYWKGPGICLSTMDDQRKKTHNHFTAIVEDVQSIYPSGFDLVCLHNRTHFFICNPTTHEFLKLPDYSIPVDSRPFYSFAFGYLPSSNQYKLIHLICHEKDKIHCNIVTLRDGGSNSTPSWRLLDGNFHFPYEDYFVAISKVCIDGIMYWLVVDESCLLRIISFDMEKEEFGRVEIPKLFRSDRNLLNLLIEMEGSLCLIHYVKATQIVQIWTQKYNQNHVWTVMYNLDFNAFDSYNTRVLGVFNGEMLLESKGSLYHYNLRNETVRKERKLNLRYWPSSPYLYTEGCFSLGTRTI